MSIRLSKKYGLNPSLVCCPICGESTSIALLGAFNGNKAPDKIEGELCDNCKSNMLQL